MDKERIKRMKDRGLLEIAQSYGFNFSEVGGKLRGLCLFHGDTGTPNLFIYPDGDTWYCFACKRGHSKSQFVAYAEKVPRKLVDSIWEKGTEMTEVMDLKLKPRVVNYRDSLLLLLATFCYNKQRQDPAFNTKKLLELDAEVSALPFIDRNTYSRIVRKIEEMK